MVLKITINNTRSHCHQRHFKNYANVIHDKKFNFGEKNKLTKN